MPMKTMLETARTPRRRHEPVRGRIPPFAQVVARDLHLGDDLGGGQVAHQGLGAGMAEGAVERAAHLAGDAERAAIGFGDIDGLDLDALAWRPVRISHLRVPSAETCSLAISRPLQRAALGELVEQRTRDVAHRCEFADAAMIDPMPELPGAHPQFALGHAYIGERARDLGAGGAGEANGGADRGRDDLGR